MESVEDCVVGRAERADGVVGAIINGEPLPIGAGEGNTRRILSPGVAVVVAY